ncbi:hypothetical protein HanRHA438_Chr10g0479951 [Helianthus annuus]|nr:hypothetical protein HanIR_Chr10g0502281 [Helianthus annuus]KAJ0881964.1 hypothetical protein HanRHA438_Chr10g0479951 [Helianthus annuus]
MCICGYTYKEFGCYTKCLSVHYVRDSVSTCKIWFITCGFHFFTYDFTFLCTCDFGFVWNIRFPFFMYMRFQVF